MMSHDSETSTTSPRVAIVTGASAGIGAATALMLAKRGWHVLAVARRHDRLADLSRQSAASGLPGHIEPLALDVTASDAPTCIVTAARRLTAGGRIDALVNNAGAGLFKPLTEITDEAWRRLMTLNLEAPFRLTREVLPTMIEQRSGTIINVSSVAGSTTIPKGSAYCASKHALEAMSGCLVEEVRQFGVRVTLICPGSVASEFLDASDGLPTRAFPDQSWMIQPEHVAVAIADAIEAPGNTFTARIELRPLVRPS